MLIVKLKAHVICSYTLHAMTTLYWGFSWEHKQGCAWNVPHGRSRPFNSSWYSAHFIHEHPHDWNTESAAIKAHHYTIFPLYWNKAEPLDPSLEGSTLLVTSMRETALLILSSEKALELRELSCHLISNMKSSKLQTERMSCRSCQIYDAS